MSGLRFQVVGEAFKKEARYVETPEEATSSYFGKYTFGKEQMSQYLSKDTVKKINEITKSGKPLDRSIADQVAAGMRQWAQEMRSLE